jgi:hypothetical protein
MEGCDNNLAPPPPYNEDVFTTGSEGLSVPPPPTYVDVMQHREEYSSVGEPTSSSYLPDAPLSVPYPSPPDNPSYYPPTNPSFPSNPVYQTPHQSTVNISQQPPTTPQLRINPDPLVIRVPSSSTRTTQQRTWDMPRNDSLARKALRKWRYSILYSIVAMFCFFPLGIVACVKVLRARRFYDTGDYYECVKESDRSLIFVPLSCGIGGFLCGISVIIILPTILSVYATGMSQ